MADNSYIRNYGDTLLFPRFITSHAPSRRPAALARPQRAAELGITATPYYFPDLPRPDRAGLPRLPGRSARPSLASRRSRNFGAPSGRPMVSAARIAKKSGK